MCSTPSVSASRAALGSLAAAGRREHQHFHARERTRPRAATPDSRPSRVWRATLPGPAAAEDDRQHEISRSLPQLDGELFLTDGGIETVLIFHEGLDLPAFAAFDLLKDEAGTEALRRYYAPYAALAAERGVGFVAESPTWRASPRWAARDRLRRGRARRVQPPGDRADGGRSGSAYERPALRS